MARGVATGTTGRVLDALMLLYVLVWFLIGNAVSGQVAELAQLGTTVESVGGAVQRTGEAVAGVQLPLLGDELRNAGDRVAQAGRDAQREARASAEQARDTGTLLGWAVALIPTLPVLLLYLPARWAAERERRAVRRALARGTLRRSTRCSHSARRASSPTTGSWP